MPSPRWKRLAQNLALTLAVTLAGLAVLEGALRLTGFRWVLYPEQIEFGKPDPVLMETGFEPDAEVFWVPPGYAEKLAALRREPPALVLQGDSCTQLGHYDEALAAFVRERTGRSPSLANLGVAGWTTHQGLAQLRRDVVPLAPEVVTIYFGWNDHWIGFGVEDSTVASMREVFSSRWSRLRLVQLATRSWVAWRAGRSGYPNRVAPEDFRTNLEEMVRVSRDTGIRPMLLTAPSNHRTGEEPEYLDARWLRDLSELVPLHRAYVDAVRAVATENDAALCDLEAAFAAMPPEVKAQLFREDGIHLTELGDQAIAARLFDCLAREGWIELLVEPPVETPDAG